MNDGRGNRLPIKWPPAVKLLALPGILAGVGGLLVWLMILLEHSPMGQATGVAGGIQLVLAPLFIIGAVLAGNGAVFAPPFVIGAILMALYESVSRRGRLRPVQAWLWALGGVAGVAIAWTSVPRLL